MLWIVVRAVAVQFGAALPRHLITTLLIRRKVPTKSVGKGKTTDDASLTMRSFLLLLADDIESRL